MQHGTGDTVGQEEVASLCCLLPRRTFAEKARNQSGMEGGNCTALAKNLHTLFSITSQSATLQIANFPGCPNTLSRASIRQGSW
jgi:hypothetical protein